MRHGSSRLAKMAYPSPLINGVFKSLEKNAMSVRFMHKCKNQHEGIIARK